MFGSKKSNEAAVVSRESVFRGSLETTGLLHVDGQVEGEIDVDGEVSIGPDGLVLGEIRCRTLTVAGRIEGQVHVRGLLRITKGGFVGDVVFYESLEVEKGGSISGHSEAITSESRTRAASVRRRRER